jgi:dipeptidyl-peptidase-3
MKEHKDNFKYFSEQFADIMILRYYVPGFDELTLKQKKLTYYLYEAALSGREIIYDQNYKYNLLIKNVLEFIVRLYKGNRNTNEFKKFMIYVKRFWFSNGIHHHYSMKKIIPDFSSDYFKKLIENTQKPPLNLVEFPAMKSLVDKLVSLIFDPEIASQRVNLDPNSDVIKTSANNFYEGLTQKEVEKFYKTKIDKKISTPVSYGLNSKLVKESGKIFERTWYAGGMYAGVIKQIIFWLEQATKVAENKNQKMALQKLIQFYQTGNLRRFDEYSILWLKDNKSVVDTVNGFIETYGDPLGYKGSFEGIVYIRDKQATKRIDAISKQAQWFEDNSPIDKKFKKKKVKGISAKAINVVVESGDSSPSTPIGINLPNSNWIREKYGSKSVNLCNIVYAYNKVKSELELKEFTYSEKDVHLALKYEDISDDLHTDMHEVIGHGSGQILPGVGAPHNTLKNYASTIEETRADLVALYYLPDKKLIDIGVATTFDVAKAGYNKYFRNGLLVQLARIEIGDKIEESHMRNRQLICRWAFEKGKKEKIIEKKTKDGKTFFVINNYKKLRSLLALLLKEVQRITSEGDYEAAKKLVETYGVKIDLRLHKEVKKRYAKLKIPPYKGFINPVLVPVYKNGKIVNIKIKYQQDFTEQMMYYSKKYFFKSN